MNFRLPIMNRVMIVGNLVADPKLNKTSTNVSVSNFRIACSRKFKNAKGEPKEETCYTNIVAWMKLAEACYRNLKKGDAVFVEGELQSKNWETSAGDKRTTTEVLAKRIQFLTKKDFIVETDEQENDEEVGEVTVNEQ